MNHKIFFSVFLFSLIAVTGCGSSTPTPPVPVLAPVSGLISISTPNVQGLSRIQGAAGAVDGSTTVSINDEGTVTETTANPDGSFLVNVEAEVSDPLELTYTVSGVTDTFGHTVTNNNILVDRSIEKVTASPALSLGFAHSADGTDSFIDVFDLENGFQSLNPIQVDDFIFVDAAFNDTRSKFYLVSAVNNRVALVGTDGSIDGGAPVALAFNPLQVTADQNEPYGLIAYSGLGGPQSVGILHDNDGAAPTVTGNTIILHPTDGAAVYNETYDIYIDSGAATPMAVALSRFDTTGGTDTIVSVLSITLPNTITVEAQYNLGNALWSGNGSSSAYVEAVLFDNGSQILVTDREENQLIRLSFDGSAIAEDTRLDAQFGSFGVAVDEATNSAFVTNSNDHSLSRFNLSNNTVSRTFTTADGMGLIPGSIAIDNDPLCVITQNETSATVSFICPE